MNRITKSMLLCSAILTATGATAATTATNTVTIKGDTVFSVVADTALQLPATLQANTKIGGFKITNDSSINGSVLVTVNQANWDGNNVAYKKGNNSIWVKEDTAKWIWYRDKNGFQNKSSIAGGQTVDFPLLAKTDAANLVPGNYTLGVTVTATVG
ncbi:hypothetical protein [Citrobacter portucalensis]|uniref:hypothetical protein n=1 Tax=Citrobacter portucalensis TaxID=1639133 RepID=UPI00288AED83|nr:hypothetical protein [Citrobacter portucalensis]WNI88026.1 hypothetical protein RIK60_09765 [Citrobacter portucalensis]